MRAACLFILLAACGHRVSEPERSTVARTAASSIASDASSFASSAKRDPAPSPMTSSPAVASSPAAPSVVPSAGALPPAGRCIVPTPETPVRPIPPQGPDPRCPADRTGPYKLRRATVRVAGLDATLDVEVAERDEHRTRGLMFRKSMGEDEGMLFVFEAERELAFWMRNTCLPLDMIFAASDGTIVGIEENVPTLNDGHYAPGDCAARYVVEANAGWARRHGVKAGQKLVLGGL
jgi:uncharacterized membrane protein (UPF0127 family)